MERKYNFDIIFSKLEEEKCNVIQNDIALTEDIAEHIKYLESFVSQKNITELFTTYTRS